MGRRGPLPNPMSGRTVRGLNSLGRRRGPPRPPVDLGRARMPRNLSPMAKVFWGKHAPELERRGCLTKLDGMAFAALAEAWAMTRLIEETLQRDGLVIVGPRGKQSPHPLVREQTRWERHFLAGLRDFGMTPSSRRRLGIQDPEPADAKERVFLDLLDGGRKDPDKKKKEG